MSSTSLRIAGTIQESIADGPGIRFVIFVQGCPRRCPGCHNPQTQPLDGGYEITADEILHQIRTDPLLTGVTFSGGEPFLQAEKLIPIARECHKMGLHVMTYSGWTFEELYSVQNSSWKQLLAETDVLVDGPYREELRSFSTKFRGSSNQRLVDVALSILTLGIQTV